MRTPAIVIGCFLAVSCGTAPPPKTAPEIAVAAAANLTGVLDEIASNFTKSTGIQVVISYGATAQLAQQIENGAPFDLFAAADVEHVDGLVEKKYILPETRAIYTRGVLALWVPKGDAPGIAGLTDLVKRSVRYISVANPATAPYGKAAVDALRRANVWTKVESKVVYATNISMAKQYAGSGNADVALTAYSLVLRESGKVLVVDQSLYDPIDQALGVVAASKNAAAAKQFAAWLRGAEGRNVLNKHGYAAPQL